MGTTPERNPEEESKPEKVYRLELPQSRLHGKTIYMVTQALCRARIGDNVLFITRDPERIRVLLREIYDRNKEDDWPSFKELMKLIKVCTGRDMPDGYSGKVVEEN